jgi:hypothetical protein
MVFHVAVEFKFDASGDNRDIVDLYDVSQAVVGFQRSLALTTHLFFDNKIIVQAPHMKGAQILTSPFEEGSWKVTATILGVIGTAIVTLNNQPKETPLGNLWYSTYDYIVNRTLGVHVDYDKTLGKQLEELRQSKTGSSLTIEALQPQRLDSLCEKCETAIEMMHRPIYASKTASEASLSGLTDLDRKEIGPSFDLITYENIGIVNLTSVPNFYSGKISSYNSNTFNGRIFIEELNRQLPFELHKDSRSVDLINLITSNLHLNANRTKNGDVLYVRCYLYISRTGLIKKLLIANLSTEMAN